jgi:hypothetical protein
MNVQVHVSIIHAHQVQMPKVALQIQDLVHTSVLP